MFPVFVAHKVCGCGIGNRDVCSVPESRVPLMAEVGWSTAGSKVTVNCWPAIPLPLSMITGTCAEAVPPGALVLGIERVAASPQETRTRNSANRFKIQL
jgi:hypothetical protein